MTEVRYAYRYINYQEGSKYINSDDWLDPKPDRNDFDICRSEKIQNDAITADIIYVGSFKGRVFIKIYNP